MTIKELKKQYRQNLKTNDTKVISARIPMSSYLELIRRTKETKLSISDYVISTLFEDIETQIKREWKKPKKE